MKRIYLQDLPLDTLKTTDGFDTIFLRIRKHLGLKRAKSNPVVSVGILQIYNY